jgi:filamentous hemagglutinin
MEFVRVHSVANQQGAFLVRAKEIAGLSPSQIQKHLALPYTPTFISDVSVPPGTRIQMGRVGQQPAFGATDPGGIQYQLLNQIQSFNFTNMRPLR